jgi:hypothetical protein
MSGQQATLRQFFSYTEDKLSKTSLSSAESFNSMKTIKENILAEAKTALPISFSDITKKIGDLLDIPISDILATAWNKCGLLLKYTDKEKYPPDKIYFVHLAEHTIKSEHKPYMEITLDEKPVGKINFNVTLSLTLKGIILKIQDGRIKGINPGECKGKGAIQCEGAMLLEQETESFSLPGSVDFGEGIPIA